MLVLSFIDTIATNFRAGGPFMFAIAILLHVALGIGVERTYMLFMKLYVDGVGFMATVQKLLVNGRIPQAIKVCDRYKKTALARVVRAGLSVANQGEMPSKMRLMKRP